MPFNVIRIRKWRVDADKDKRTGKKYGGKETVRYGIYGMLEARFREGKKVLSKHIKMLPELTIGVLKNGLGLARKERKRMQRKA